MRRFKTFAAMIVILMAGFMSVCAADENCTSDVVHASMHNISDAHASKDLTKDAPQDHCGMMCHVAPHSIPQTVSSVFTTPVLDQERIISMNETICLGLYKVLDQPPRA